MVPNGTLDGGNAFWGSLPDGSFSVPYEVQ